MRPLASLQTVKPKVTKTPEFAVKGVVKRTPQMFSGKSYFADLAPISEEEEEEEVEENTSTVAPPPGNPGGPRGQRATRWCTAHTNTRKCSDKCCETPTRTYKEVVQDKRPQGEQGGLRALRTVLPAGLNSVREDDQEEWEELEVAVDSAATETVIMSTQLSSVETTEGKPFKQGVQYEVADGNLIPNLGEKNFVGVSEGGYAREVKAQVADVNKALLSVAKVIQAGNKVVFDGRGSYIEDTHTGEKIPLREENGMFLLKL